MSSSNGGGFLCPYCGKLHDIKEDTCPAKGLKISSHQKLSENILEGKYFLKKIIGEGGMGVVYEAVHTIVERKLAVKVLNPEIANDESIVDRFYNEAKTAASIGNEHIIEITDMGVHNKSPFIVMEFLEGRNLAQYMEGKILSCDQAVAIIIQLLDALYAVHEKGVIHRDLKPENIFLIKRSGRNDFVKILDFGISKLKTPEAQNLNLTRTGTILGTPYYMAPEQAAGKKDSDHRIDLYATGVILYEMLTGKLPFFEDNYNALIIAITSDDPPKPSLYNPDIPPEIEKIILKAISRAPDDRYANALAFFDALQPFAPSWAIRPSMIVDALAAAATFQQEIRYSPEKRSSGTKHSISATALGSEDMLISEQEGTGAGKKRFAAIAGASLAVIAIIVLAAVLGPGFFNKEKEQEAETESSYAIELPEEAVEKKPETQNTEEGTDPAYVPPSSEDMSGQPEKVTLTLKGLPKGAVVTLDGEKMTANPVFISPSDAKRALSIIAPGYTP